MSMKPILALGWVGGEGMTQQDTLYLWGKRYETCCHGSRRYAVFRTPTRTYYQDPQYGLIWTWHAYEGSLLSIETRNSEHEDWQPI